MNFADDKTPNDAGNSDTSEPPADDSAGADEIVVAEVLEGDSSIELDEGQKAMVREGKAILAQGSRAMDPALFQETENLAAMGGTVGSIGLGALALIGSLISEYSGVTACIGIAMGVWGLQSAHPRWAALGIAVSAFALFLVLI